MRKDILKVLENDARATAGQISTMTGAPAAEVTEFIKQAEKDRIILKYKTIINWDKVDNEQVWALIEVKVTPQKDVGFDAIAERIYHLPQARSVYLISGTYDLFVMVVGKTNREIADFISQKLSHIDGVRGTDTQFVLKRYKEDCEIIEGEAGAKRQAVVL
ncbi:MAG: Lrp/AsnC family transcriptional regulator [Chloroflexota bacterium]